MSHSPLILQLIARHEDFHHRRRICVTMLVLLPFFLSSSLLGQTTTATQKHEPDFANVRKYIQQQMATQFVPSISVAVVRDKTILWEEGFGLANRQNHMKATELTPYSLASVTKTITGTAIMMLQERQQLNLDHPVNEYLGAAKVHSPMWNPAEATVRKVATHTAGLTTYARNCFADEPDCRISLDEAIERYGILFWPPGERFDYSNLGYGILGEVVAHASGKSYGAFLYDEIFQPLGMTHCSLPTAKMPQNSAAQYDQTTQKRTPPRQFGTPGASGAECSVHDLALFGMFQMKMHLPNQRAVLSDAAIDETHSPIGNVSEGQHYGLGWWINDDYFGYRSVFASGGTNDSSAILQMVPSEGIAVAVISNTGTTLPGAVVEEVFCELLPSFRERRENMVKNHPPEPETLQRHNSSLAGQWRGAIRTHQGNIPVALSISALGEVHAKLGSQPTALLDKASVGERSVYGLLPGEVGTDDAPRPPYDLEVDLTLRGDTLAGAATTRELRTGERGALLPYWIELKRTPK
jgi:CubicO group peptidase (beta-lactamase class C family)